jgi:hypothetical protein
MPFAVRVRLEPLESGLGQPGQHVFDGARISLLRLGPPPTQLELDTSVAAKLVLTARFIESIRRGGEQSVPLATLEGELVLGSEAVPSLTFTGKLGADATPLGLVPAEVIDEDAGLPEDDAREIRLLRFAFDDGQFFDVLEPDTAVAELLTPIDAARFDYCEISAELSVAGAVEAPAAAGDTLDILITARNPGRQELITLRLTDEVGSPMPGAAVQLLSGAKPAEKGADPSALVADGNAEVQLKTLPGASECQIAWGPSAADLRFRRRVFVDLRGDPEQANARRLRNLGYTGGADLNEDVLAFQADFGRPGSGRLQDLTADLEALHDEGDELERGAPPAPSTEAVAINGPRNREIDDRVDPSAVA